MISSGIVVVPDRVQMLFKRSVDQMGKACVFAPVLTSVQLVRALAVHEIVVDAFLVVTGKQVFVLPVPAVEKRDKFLCSFLRELCVNDVLTHKLVLLSDYWRRFAFEGLTPLFFVIFILKVNCHQIVPRFCVK